MSKRRVTLDMTAQMGEELDRLQSSTGMSISSLMRHSLALLRVYIDAKVAGNEVRIVDPLGKSVQAIIELPIFISTAGEQ